MSDDTLDAVRRDLDSVDGTALDDHPEVFDRIHRALVAELNALEEM